MDNNNRGNQRNGRPGGAPARKFVAPAKRAPQGTRFDRAPQGKAPLSGTPFARKPADRGGAGKPDGPRPVIADARRIALYALSDVNRADAYSQLALDKHLRASGISVDDKRLAAQMFYATLENRLLLKHILSQFVDRMPEPVIEDILHIAAAQILFLDRVPDHAATDEAVKQVKALGRDKYAPLVNGTLRSLIRARDAGEIKYPAREENEVAYLSVMHSLPEALTRRLIADYGGEQAEQMIAYRPDAHRQTVRPNLLKMDGPAFEKYMDGRGWTYEKGVVPNAYCVKGLNDMGSDPGFRDGLFSMQGEGSMLSALAMACRRGQNLLDACAAPGGKSALMCELMGDTGRVQSWEIHDHRAELLRAVKKRLHLDSMRVLVRDATVFRPDCECEFDGVLIDAPCSGLGVMINKPDIKYRVTEEDLTALAELQKKILHACAPYVKVGGRLVYSTCTVLKDENERQVTAFLKKHPEYEPELDDTWLPETLRPLFKDGMLQLQAYRDGMEGFFIARMRRVAL